MRLRDRLWQLPLRLPTDAYILDAGVSKWDVDDGSLGIGLALLFGRASDGGSR
ncbi:hypothetical protein GCM10009609_36900 [Pseudonocardia aurantiaca]|uniref:Uncharacterized protein n=1 Tax=Pseudonocardia aurantiaca TaxID=75290 RepID=A0ABW4FRB6_9PSEU